MKRKPFKLAGTALTGRYRAATAGNRRVTRRYRPVFMESEIAKQLALVRAVSEKVQFLSDSIDSGQDANVHGQSVSMRTRLLEQLQQIHGTLTDLGGALVPTGPDNRHDDVCGLQASQPLQTDAGQQPLEQPTAGTNSPSLREIVERLRQELHAAKESESTPVPPSQSLIEPPATSRSLQSVVTPSHKAEVLPPRSGSAKSIDSDDMGLASYLSFQEDSLIDRLQGSQSSASGHVQVELMSTTWGKLCLLRQSKVPEQKMMATTSCLNGKCLPVRQRILSHLHRTWMLPWSCFFARGPRTPSTQRRLQQAAVTRANSRGDNRCGPLPSALRLKQQPSAQTTASLCERCWNWKVWEKEGGYTCDLC